MNLLEGSIRASVVEPSPITVRERDGRVFCAGVQRLRVDAPRLDTVSSAASDTNRCNATRRARVRSGSVKSGSVPWRPQQEPPAPAFDRKGGPDCDASADWRVNDGTRPATTIKVAAGSRDKAGSRYQTSPVQDRFHRAGETVLILFLESLGSSLGDTLGWPSSFPRAVAMT
jgi:hypothetical protein